VFSDVPLMLTILPLNVGLNIVGLMLGGDDALFRRLIVVV